MPHLTIHPGTSTERGPHESKILSIVADSSFNEQLTFRKFYHDWPLYKALNPLRKNIVAWIDLPPNSSFLELGAASGTITSYLAKTPGSRIVAVESSITAANTIAARCRTCDNVEIHACDIVRFETDERFDFVTLFGALESAGVATSSKTPFLDCLLAAKKFLKESGSLLVAINNRIGHQFIAGCIENPYNVPFEGLNNYPHFNGSRSFDYGEILSLVTQAGLHLNHLYFPSPDFLFPEAVLAPSAFTTKGFDPFSLMRLPTPTLPGQKQPLFNERAFLKALSPLCTPNSFMNSFFLSVSLTTASDFPADASLLAVRLNSYRADPFATRVSFFEHEGSITLEKERLCTPVPHTENYKEFFLSHHPTLDNGPYHAGFSSLEDLLAQAIRCSDHTESIRILNAWITSLKEHAAPPTSEDIAQFEQFSLLTFGKAVYLPAYAASWISGAHLDHILRNTLENGEQTKREVIDKEWALTIRIPLQLVFDRALFNFRNTIEGRLHATGLHLHPSFYLPFEVVKAFEHEALFIMSDPLSCRSFELWFQSFVMTSTRRLPDFMPDKPLALVKPEQQTVSPAMPKDESLQSIRTFIDTIATMVEAGKYAVALNFYAEKRQCFTDSSTELNQVDVLMKKLRMQVKPEFVGRRKGNVA